MTRFLIRTRYLIPILGLALAAADAARWHGVKDRVLVSEFANSIRFFRNFITNAEEL